MHTHVRKTPHPASCLWLDSQACCEKEEEEVREEEQAG